MSGNQCWGGARAVRGVGAVMRLLPWGGEGDRPVYLRADDEGSFVARFADGLESVQLAMAERLLDRAESAWAARGAGTETAELVPHLCHALRDAVRVARSLRERLPVPDREDEPDGEAGELPFAELPLTVPAGPGAAAVAYRWARDPVCVGSARRLLRRQLGAWGMAALADIAELVLSELATNALRHARDPDDRLIETRFERLPGGALRIEVHDGDPSTPQRREPSADADSGRGLALVDALTGGRWGIGARDGRGKHVWAECAATGGA